MTERVLLDSEFEIEGVVYRTTRRMPATTQFHVLRRISPLITEASGILLYMKDGGELLDIPMTELKKLSEAASSLPDEVINYVIAECLALVEREKEGGTGWARVWNIQARAPMFELSMVDMLQVCMHVIMKNLGPF